MQVKDAMTTPVVSVAPDATVAEAIALMTGHRISGLPVIDARGALAGMVSEGDFLRRTENGTLGDRPGWLETFIFPGAAAERYARTHARHVREVMTRDVAWISQEAPLHEAVAMMEARGVKRLPVLAGETVAGIISRADVLRTLAGLISARTAPGLADPVIRQGILAALQAENWAPVATFDVGVQQGVVSLSGVISDERQRAAVRALVENVPGVVALHDHLVWVEPFSGMTMASPEDQAQEAAAARRRS